MKKADTIRKYGIEAYKKKLEQNAAWRAAHPEKVKANNAEHSNKGGIYYEKWLEYKRTGLQGEKKKVRNKHNYKYAPIKRIIDPNGLTQIHHEYLNDGTANYTGVALVERDQHQHGYIDVIHILEGEITLMTEKEIRGNNERLPSVRHDREKRFY